MAQEKRNGQLWRPTIPQGIPKSPLQTPPPPPPSVQVAGRGSSGDFREELSEEESTLPRDTGEEGPLIKSSSI